jgi:hypothetical protein
MRTGISITVMASDRKRLQALVKNRNAAQKHAWRAEIVLPSADGAPRLACGAGWNASCGQASTAFFTTRRDPPAFRRWTRPWRNSRLSAGRSIVPPDRRERRLAQTERQAALLVGAHEIHRHFTGERARHGTVGSSPRITLFGFQSGAALSTVVGVLVEVPVMLSVVHFVRRSRGRYERAARARISTH